MTTACELPGARASPNFSMVCESRDELYWGLGQPMSEASCYPISMRITPKERTLEELTDLGLRREALGLARRRLKDGKLSPEGFAEAARAVLIHGWRLTASSEKWEARKWLPPLEAAYRRMSPLDRKAARWTMVWVYLNADRHQEAAKSINQRINSSLEFANTLYVLLKLKRWRAIRRLETLGTRLLAEHESGIERSRIAAAMAKVAWQRGDFERCRALSRDIGCLDIFWRESLLMPVLCDLAEARAALNNDKARIGRFAKSPKTDMDRALPDFRSRQLGRAKRELSRIAALVDRCLGSKYWPN